MNFGLRSGDKILANFMIQTIKIQLFDHGVLIKGKYDLRIEADL